MSEHNNLNVDMNEDDATSSAPIQENTTSDTVTTSSEEADTQSVCSALRDLADHLEMAKAPLFHPDEVLVPREETAELIRGLAELCTEEAIGDPSEDDELLDSLAASRPSDHYKPLELVRKRASEMMEDAQKHANMIIEDARTLQAQMIDEAEAKIQERYDDLDRDIAARMSVTREESDKRLATARRELTASRQKSMEILEDYKNRAAEDYEGYWERAERTVLVSLQRSESILHKACDLYERELDVIRKDLHTLKTIIKDLKQFEP